MAWSVALTLDKTQVLSTKEKMFVFKLACTSDASSSGDQTLSTLLLSDLGATLRDHYMQQIRGKYFYGVEYVPDGTATPTENPTVTIDNENGTVILNKTFTAGTAAFEPGTTETGMYVPITDLIFASTTLANTKAAEFRIIIQG